MCIGIFVISKLDFALFVLWLPGMSNGLRNRFLALVAWSARAVRACNCVKMVEFLSPPHTAAPRLNPIYLSGGKGFGLDHFPMAVWEYVETP